MEKKTKHMIKFEHTDGDVFVNLGDKELRAEIEGELPENVSVERGYSEYPKPYGHNPYISVVTQDETGMTSKERMETIHQTVIRTSKSLINLDLEIIESRAEGWA